MGAGIGGMDAGEVHRAFVAKDEQVEIYTTLVKIRGGNVMLQQG